MIYNNHAGIIRGPLQQVFKLLKQAGLTAKLERCQFSRKEREYLEFKLTQTGTSGRYQYSHSTISATTEDSRSLTFFPTTSCY